MYAYTSAEISSQDFVGLPLACLELKNRVLEVTIALGTFYSMTLRTARDNAAAKHGEFCST